MAESTFKYFRKIYCTKDLFNYKEVFHIKSNIYIKDYVFKQLSIIIEGQTCSQLIKNCHNLFGENYKYIQSGLTFSYHWDTVIAQGELCDHKFSSFHYKELVI